MGSTGTWAMGTAVAIAMGLIVSGCSGGTEEPAAQTVFVTETVEAAPTTDEPEETTEAQETSEEPEETEEATTEAETAEPASAAPVETQDPIYQGTTGLNVPSVPEDYADSWVRAWGLGDDTAMAVYADRFVQDQFAGTAGGGAWSRQDSGRGGGLHYTKYVDGNSGDWLVVESDLSKVDIGAQHAIVNAFRVPAGASDISSYGRFTWHGDTYWNATDWYYEEPGAGTPMGLTTDVGEYADEFVRAWGAGDPSRAETYANSTGMTLFGVTWKGGKDWARQGVRGDEVTYRDGGGNTLTVRVHLDRVARGASDAVVQAFVN